MKVLITGITGFIGSSLTNHILKSKKNFLVYGVFRNKKKLNPSIISHPNFIPIESSIENLNKNIFTPHSSNTSYSSNRRHDSRVISNRI